MTPATTMRWQSPSLSMTPYPVRSLPQSTPSTRTLLRHRLQLLLIDIEVGVDALHVVMIFQDIGQPEHGVGVLALELDQILRHPRDRSVLTRNSVRFQNLQNSFMCFGPGEHFPTFAIAAHIVRAGFEYDIHELIFGDLFAGHE